MKRYITFAFLCLSACGCTLTESSKEKINPRPTLLLDYDYRNDNGITTTDKEVA